MWRAAAHFGRLFLRDRALEPSATTGLSAERTPHVEHDRFAGSCDVLAPVADLPPIGLTLLHVVGAGSRIMTALVR